MLRIVGFVETPEIKIDVVSMKELKQLVRLVVFCFILMSKWHIPTSCFPFFFPVLTS